MNTTFGNILNASIPQTGFAPRQDPNGGWSATREYRMLRTTFDLSTLSQLGKGVPITSIDSTVEPYWSFLKIDSKDVVFEEAEHVVVRVTFTGAAFNQYGDNGLGTDAQATYRLDGNLTEVPFSEHPKFAALSYDEKSTLGKLIAGQAEWAPDPFADPPAYGVFYPRTGEGTGNKLPAQEQLGTEDAKSFAALIAEGVQTYLRPTFTWTETTQGSQGLSSAQLNLLGRVSSPRGEPPRPNGSREWMLTSATQDQRGDLYQTRIEWTMSERGGYNAFLYED